MKILKKSLLIFSALVIFGCEKTISEPESNVDTSSTSKTCLIASQKNTILQNGAESEVLDYTYTYNTSTRILAQNIKSNKNSVVKNNTYTYDSKDRLIEVITPADFYDNIKYVYDTDGKMTQITRRIRQSQAVEIIVYRYKDATTIEIFKYDNAVATANLKRAEQITVNDKKSPLKIDVIEVIGGVNYKGTQTTYTYNTNGQIVTQTNTMANGTVSSVSRYVYDALGNCKNYYKSGTSAEYLVNEFNELFTSPIPKSNFKGFAFSVPEPWENYGVDFSKFGKVKNYDSKGNLYATVDRKWEYDSDNLLKKQSTSTTIGANKTETIMDYSVSCQ